MDFATLMDSQSGIVALGMAAVSGVCAFICAFMPAPTEQSGMLYRIVYELLNWIGCNKGKAKNADDAGNGGSDAWSALVRILQLVLEGFREYRRRSRVGAVRSDGGSAWLRKFGGADKRASRTDDAGDDHH